MGEKKFLKGEEVRLQWQVIRQSKRNIMDFKVKYRVRIQDIKNKSKEWNLKGTIKDQIIGKDSYIISTGLRGHTTS